jgi:signal transduction histidine kinase/GAF domain-containing protein
MNQPPDAALAWPLLDLVNEGVLVVEQNGTIIYSNRAAQQLLGLSQPAASLAELYTQIAPTATWLPLLSGPAEAFLYTAAGHLHIEAQPLALDGRALSQLLLTLTAPVTAADDADELAGEQLAALARISQHLSTTLELDNVLRAVSDEAQRHTKADGCQVSLWEESEQRFVTQAQQGQLLLSPTAEQTADLIATAQPAKLTFAGAAEDGAQSGLLTPILFENEVAGLIFLVSRQPDYFSDQARLFVSALANHAAVAIGNRRRFNELARRTTLLHQRAQQIEQLVESSRVFHGDRPQDEVYEDLVYAIQEGVGFGVVMLSLLEQAEPEPHLRRVAAAGLPLARFQEMQKVRQPWAAVARLLQSGFGLGAAYFVPADAALALTQKLATHYVSDLTVPGSETEWGRLYRVRLLDDAPGLAVYRQPSPTAEIMHQIPADGHNIRATGAPTTISGLDWLPIRHDGFEGWVNRALLAEEGAVDDWHEDDLFFIPLRDSAGQPLGLISVDNPLNGRRPDESTAKALEVFANQAATAIENVQLLHDSRSFAEMLQQLHQVSQKVLREQDFDRQLQYIADGLRDAGWQQIYLTLRDEAFNLLRVVSSGLAADKLPEQQRLWSPARWRRLMAKPELSRFRLGSCYYLPAADPWVARQLASDGEEADPERPGDSLFLPLYDRHNKIVGIINLDEPDNGHRPDAHSLQTIELYAQFATAIIENAQLYQETQRQLAELRTVNEVGQAVSTTLDLDLLSQKIASSLAAAYQVDSYYIALYNAEADAFDYPFIVDQATPQDTSPTPADRGPTNHIFRTGEPLLINSRADWDQVDQELYGEPSCSYLGVPMRVADEVIGVLAIQDYHNENAFNRQDIRTLTTIAAQVAVAITNARLIRELRKLNEQLDTRVAERTRALGEERDRVQILLRITTELSTSLDQQHVSDRALHMVNEFVNANQGGIILVDPDSGELTYRAGFGLDGVQQGSLISGQGIIPKLITQTLKERQSATVADLTALPEWRNGSSPIKARSLLAVPLIYGDEVIGCMILLHQQAGAFTPKQLELVEAAAAQVANAINNARLYLLIRDQAERLGSMLREEQIEAAKNEAILQSIADGVLVADPHGQIVLANMPVSYILDMPRPQLISKAAVDLQGLYGDSGDKWVATITDWAQNRRQVQRNMHLAERMEYGGKVISVQLSPVFTNNQFFGTVSIFRDITKEVEVDRMKSEFVSTVSHELRTPMTSIKGYVDLLLMGAAGLMSDPQSRYLQVIKNNADRLSMLVNDLLDISRIETGKAELELRPLDVPQFVKQIVNVHLRGRIEHEGKPIHISTRMAPSLPLIYADPKRLTQIMTNLVDNAFHYTPRDGEITITAGQNGAFVAIRVQDTGIGIAPENLERVFDRFFRAEDDAVKQVAGTGLGLAIVRGLVEMHGGTIDVESTPGQGSTFTVNLPSVQEDRERM